MRRTSKTSETKTWENSDGEPTYLGDKSQEDQARSGERNAAVSRQVEAMSSFKEFGPIIAAYSFLVFFAWVSYWFILFYGHLFLSAESMLKLYEPYAENILALQGGNYSFEKILKETIACVTPSENCGNELYTTMLGYDDIYHTINVVSTAIISATIAILVMTYMFISRLSDFDPNSSRNVCLLCCIISEGISFISHLGMCLNWFPVVYSVWHRASHILLLGEWIAVAPFHIILLHTFDGITTVDLFSMWISSCGQGLSNAFGIMASLSSSPLIANATLALSLLLFSTIYFDLFRSYRHYASYRNELSARRRNFVPRVIGIQKEFMERKALRFIQLFGARITQLDRLYSSNAPSRFKSSAETDFIVQEIVSQARLNANFNKFFLTLCCTISWSILVIGHTLGALPRRIGYIDHISECYVIMGSDVLSRCVFVALIYYAHSQFMTEKQILEMVQVLEKASSSVGTVCPFFSFDPSMSQMNNIPFSSPDGFD